MHAVVFGSITSVSLFAMAGLSAMIDHSFIGFLGLAIAVLFFSGISLLNQSKTQASVQGRSSKQSHPYKQVYPTAQSYTTATEDIKA